MSTVIQIGPNFHGYGALKRLVLFGASYCSVGYDPKYHTPSKENPLGVPFPGEPGAMWQEPNEPNWIGHLIFKYLPDGMHTGDVFVYDFAVGGDTTAGALRQIENGFSKYLGANSGADWTADNSLFITWIGINDCAFPSEMEASLSRIATGQKRLYDLGARNFMLIDVPPIDRSPTIGFKSPTSATNRDSEQVVDTFVKWNTGLRELAERFAKDCPDATVLLFSSYQVFTDILDHPETYRFPPSDVRRRSGTIWYDHLHPTTKVHDIVALRMSEFLGGIAL